MKFIVAILSILLVISMSTAVAYAPAVEQDNEEIRTTRILYQDGATEDCYCEAHVIHVKNEDLEVRCGHQLRWGRMPETGEVCRWCENCDYVKVVGGAYNG